MTGVHRIAVIEDVLHLTLLLEQGIGLFLALEHVRIFPELQDLLVSRDVGPGIGDRQLDVLAHGAFEIEFPAPGARSQSVAPLAGNADALGTLGSWPATIRISEDFPAPFTPRTPDTIPGCRLKLMSRRMIRSANFRLRWFTVRIG